MAENAARQVSAAPVLALEDISHRFDRMLAVDRVGLSIAAGEIVCLVGPSGCGKSTLLRIAAGLEELQTGTVWVDGRLVADTRQSLPPERRGVGLVFQDYALFPHLSVLDNVRFGLSALPGHRQAERALEALAQVDMGDLAHAFPHTLSGGQQQRVALARALAPQPRVLLLDEPFSGLDGRLRRTVRDHTLHVLEKSGAATMLVTHDPEEAMFMADRIALMCDGRLVQTGTPRALYFEPAEAFAAEFFGEVNTLRGRVADGVVKTPLGTLPAPGCGESEVVEVLVRPEGLSLTADPVRGADLFGHVEAARLLGRTTLVHLSIADVGGGRLHVHARVPGAFLPGPGERVAVTLNPDLAFVFPAR